jgi:S-layer homology domain
MKNVKQFGQKLLLALLLLGAFSASFFLGNLYGKFQSEKDLARLQGENDALKESVANAATSSTSATSSPDAAPQDASASTAVTFEDIGGTFGEKEITQLAQLGVFGEATGKFNPQKAITRAEFVRWLVRANNAIWFDRSEKTIREAEGGEATFADVPTTHPDFRYIQGVANAGIAIGFEGKNFKPDEPLTREQMIAIKIGLDKGGIENEILDPKKVESSAGDNVTATELAEGVPDWSDRTQIAARFIPAFNSQYYVFWGNTREYSVREDKFKNVDRTFGSIKAFKPQLSVTRAEAATCLSLIGNHTTDRNEMSARTAEKAIEEKAKAETSP